MQALFHADLSLFRLPPWIIRTPGLNPAAKFVRDSVRQAARLYRPLLLLIREARGRRNRESEEILEEPRLSRRAAKKPDSAVAQLEKLTARVSLELAAQSVRVITGPAELASFFSSAPHS